MQGLNQGSVAVCLQGIYAAARRFFLLFQVHTVPDRAHLHGCFGKKAYNQVRTVVNCRTPVPQDTQAGRQGTVLPAVASCFGATRPALPSLLQTLSSFSRLGI